VCLGHRRGPPAVAFVCALATAVGHPPLHLCVPWPPEVKAEAGKGCGRRPGVGGGGSMAKGGRELMEEGGWRGGGGTMARGAATTRDLGWEGGTTTCLRGGVLFAKRHGGGRG
jgi:hypothetical protein